MNRLRERGKSDLYNLAAIEAHPTEVQLADRLPSLADLAVDGSVSADDTVGVILDWLRIRLTVLPG